MLSVNGSIPPAASIFIIIDVPDRGSPDTITSDSLSISHQPLSFLRQSSCFNPAFFLNGSSRESGCRVGKDRANEVSSTASSACSTDLRTREASLHLKRVTFVVQNPWHESRQHRSRHH